MAEDHDLSPAAKAVALILLLILFLIPTGGIAAIIQLIPWTLGWQVPYWKTWAGTTVLALVFCCMTEKFGSRKH